MHFSKKLLYSFCISLIFVAYFASASQAIGDRAWVDIAPSTLNRDAIDETSAIEKQVPCVQRDFIEPDGWGGSRKVSLCLMHGDGFSLAADQSHYYMFISFDNDQTFKLIFKDSWSRFYVITGTKKVIAFRQTPQYRTKLLVHNDFLKHLIPNGDNFSYDYADGDYPGIGDEIIPSAWALSQNNRYIVYSHGLTTDFNDRVSRIDLTTGERRSVGSLPYLIRDGTARMAINDSGDTIVVSQKGKLKFWHIEMGCMVDERMADLDSRMEVDFCPTVKRSDEAYSGAPNVEHEVYNLSFDNAGGSLSLIDKTDTSFYNVRIGYETSNAPLLRHLALGDSYASGEGDLSIDGQDYYLSGTNTYGDYKNGIPREMCHTSSRSYPFLLASNMGLAPSSNMQTVACSGAVTTDITSYDGENGATMLKRGYMGQETQGIGWGKNVPRLAGVAQSKMLQDQARARYIPGRIQQVEFVQKTKPEVVTVMIGGNDMKFGDVIANCSMNLAIGIGKSCKYATQEGRQELAQIIHDDYPSLVKTYRAIKQAGSAYTKVYVVGYPRLISALNPLCSSPYDQSERQTIVQAIDYANATIKQAASAAGVNYIDISDSFKDNELCSGGPKYQYITYLSQLSYSKLASEVAKGKQAKDIFDKKSMFEKGLQTDVVFLGDYIAQRGVDSYDEFSYSPWTAIQGAAQQMMHPNSLGHQAMFRSIVSNFGKSGMDECTATSRLTCTSNPQPSLQAPGPDAYMTGISIRSGKTCVSGNGPVSLESKVHNIGRDIGNSIKKGKDTIIRLIPKPEWGTITSLPTITLHSDPTYLGTMSRSVQDYSLSITLPSNVPVGMHTLYISAPLDNGQELLITKDVFVEGPEGDIDDDGIRDAIDTCAFGVPSHEDVDSDGIADNCDMYVDASSSSASGPVAKVGSDPMHSQQAFSKIVLANAGVAVDSPLFRGDSQSNTESRNNWNQKDTGNRSQASMTPAVRKIELVSLIGGMVVCAAGLILWWILRRAA